MKHITQITIALAIAGTACSASPGTSATAPSTVPSVTVATSTTSANATALSALLRARGFPVTEPSGLDATGAATCAALRNSAQLWKTVDQVEKGQGYPFGKTPYDPLGDLAVVAGGGHTAAENRVIFDAAASIYCPGVLTVPTS